MLMTEKVWLEVDLLNDLLNDEEVEPEEKLRIAKEIVARLLK